MSSAALQLPAFLRPYVPIPTKKQLYSPERTGVSVDISKSGTAIMISERGRDGASIPKHITAEEDFPFFADMRLANGDWITVEVHLYKAADLPEDFDDEAALLPPQPIGRGANLFNFSKD